MNTRNSFTRDYRLKEHVLLHIPSQDSVNNDMPPLRWLIPFSFLAILAFVIWMWLLAILLEPQIAHSTLAVYNADLPISEYNNEHTANPLTPLSETPLSLSEPLPDGNGLSYTSTPLSAGSPSESVRFPTSVLPLSTTLQSSDEGSFYTSTLLSAGSQASELLMLSGVLDNPNVNDGWED